MWSISLPEHLQSIGVALQTRYFAFDALYILHMPSR